MESFNEICERYGMEPEDFERKLYRTLKNIGDCKEVRVKREDFQAYMVRIDYLHNNGFIYRGKKNELTIKGQDAYKRGWVIRNEKEIKRQKIKKIALWSITAIIIPLFAAILPDLIKCVRKLTLKKADQVEVLPFEPIDTVKVTTHQYNEGD